MATVKCDHVSIRYITGDFKSIGLKEYIIRRLTRNYHVKEFWADKDVTFEIDRGDMLGIIGSNGAGKSTLLKAVTGIMVPTGGSITTKGNIAALLELASGFDGDMTVRENTYLRGALLGYTRKFLDEKYDEIIEFAELQDFQEIQAVKADTEHAFAFMRHRKSFRRIATHIRVVCRKFHLVSIELQTDHACTSVRHGNHRRDLVEKICAIHLDRTLEVCRDYRFVFRVRTFDQLGNDLHPFVRKKHVRIGNADFDCRFGADS